tara:strand:+ start:1328 stop:1714 length:387 start_codon:yes stop_codon:yes gene_type:complete
MALETTFSTNPVKTIIASETALTSTAGTGINNITGGAAYIHSVEVSNSSFGTDIYVKLYNAASAVAGTTDADIILLCKANVNRVYNFFPGVLFANGVTAVCTTTLGQAGTTAPGTPPPVKFVFSESAS